MDPNECDYFVVFSDALHVKDCRSVNPSPMRAGWTCLFQLLEDDVEAGAIILGPGVAEV
jgi:hypothetical protein